jgi:UDP-N-acetylglucosamine diphosphorylase/glucosamine-1-phosphate N-acetyltransferase
MHGPEVYRGVIDQHVKGGYDVTVSAYNVENPTAYGVFEIEDGRATRLVEKPHPEQTTSNLANAGVYAMTREIWDAIDRTEISERGEYELTDSVSMLIQRGNVGAYTIQSWWIDIGKPWDLLIANQYVLNAMKMDISGDVEGGATLKGQVAVADGATVRNGAYIEGPAYIGTGAVVGPNCYIRSHTALCRKVKVGNAVEVKNSIIMDGTNVGHLSYVGDSILGQRVNFGAGTITANLRHDDSHVHVTVKGQRMPSGRRKLGAIIGDDVKTGISTSIAPGVVIHQNARTGIGVIVDRDIPADTLVIAEQPKRMIDLRDS